MNEEIEQELKDWEAAKIEIDTDRRKGWTTGSNLLRKNIRYLREQIRKEKEESSADAI